jgi:predicted CXXCH cytochrome family protein
MMLRISWNWRKLGPLLGKTLRVLVAALVLVFAVVACRSVHRAVVVLPNIPGAKYAGSKECEQCHDTIYRDFATADHSRLFAAGTNAPNVGCESCHGPSAAHAQSGGEVKPPFAFTSGRPAGNSSARFPIDAARAVENVCYQCHNNVRGSFNLPSHHPVPEGRMTCTECHSPHKGSIHKGGGTAWLSADEGCVRCHAAQRGPYVFEHEASREGCTTCHAAHGSINDKMLTVRDGTLCMKCHFQRASGGRLLIGGSDHTLRVQQGTCWTSGCHEAVHGSRVSSSLRF